MSKYRFLAVAGIIVILILSMAISAGEKKGYPNDLTRLIDYMTGSFSSAEQAEADSAYYDIRLQMFPVWLERSEARWFYIEQARSDYPDQPYRQRVYRVSQIDDSTFQSSVFELPDSHRFIGAWRREIPLGNLTPDSLIAREGCDIILVKQGNVFVGGTQDNNCPGSLRGAAYATSEVTIKRDAMISWDRGFDTEGNQVWGSEKGGYIFKKIR